MQFESVSKTFFVADSVINCFIKKEVIPQIELTDEQYHRLGCKAPTILAPVVGMLMGRSGDCYTSRWNEVSALAKTGVRIIFLTCHHCSVQLQWCKGVLLPDGVFEKPERYYVGAKNFGDFASIQQKAYCECVRLALYSHLPMLGIGSGAQLIAAEIGLKLYRSFDCVETPIEHNTRKSEAHRLNVFANTPLAQIFDGDNQFFVNSHHHELLAPVRVQREEWRKHHCTGELPLDIYAEANDGTPEAWGLESRHILCVQWNPEDMVAIGNEKMQRIYQWLADEINNR